MALFDLHLIISLPAGSKFICKTPTLDMKIAGLADLPVSYVTAALKADNHHISLNPFPIHADPVIDPLNSTNAGH